MSAHLEQIVHVPEPQVVEEIAGVVQIFPQERFSKCFIVRIVNVPVLMQRDLEDREGSTSACCVARRRQSQSNSLDSRRNLGHPGNLEKFLTRRVRVRDDPGRSPQIELEPERSF